jgi:hypothetical protein
VSADEFDDVVNMTPSELERWLDTDESKEVGWKDDDGSESVGHASGRRIVEIKRTKQADLSDDDRATWPRSSPTCTATWPRAGRRTTWSTRAGATAS